MGFIGGLLNIVGSIFGLVGGLNQASAQKKELQAQQRMNDLKAARERMQQVREARIKRAQVEQSAANSGAADSSGAISGAQTVTSQIGQNIGFLNQQQGLSDRISHYKTTEINAQGIQAIGQGISALGDKATANSDEIASIFGG